MYSSLHLWSECPDEERCCRRPSLPWKAGQHPLGWQMSTCKGLYQGGFPGMGYHSLGADSLQTLWMTLELENTHPRSLSYSTHPGQLRALEPDVAWLSSGHLGRRMSWDHWAISSPFFAVHTLSLPDKRQLGGPHCRDSIPPPLPLTQPPVLRSSLPGS